jgi:hypothetical protein
MTQKAWGLACCVASLISLGIPSAHGALYTIPVDNTADNSFAFTLVPLAALTDVLSLSGSVVVDIETTGNDVTSIAFVSGDVSIQDTSILQDVNFFGTIPGTLGVGFTNARFSVSGGPFAVNAGAFDPTGLSFQFFDGTLDLSIDSTVTGTINTQVDYATNPSTVTFGFSSREGNITFDGTTFQLFLPMDVASDPIPFETLNIFLAINTQFGGSVAIPEASSLVLIGGVVLAGGIVRARRQR